MGVVFLKPGARCKNLGVERSLDEGDGGLEGDCTRATCAGRTRGQVLEEDEMKEERRLEKDTKTKLVKKCRKLKRIEEEYA